jgi:hypothetical protein
LFGAGKTDHATAPFGGLFLREGEEFVGGAREMGAGVEEGFEGEGGGGGSHGNYLRLQ